MKKMKDVRGTSAASVRNAISKEFKLEIPASNKQKNLYQITEWKKSMNVKECYNKLYADDDNVIEDITRYAFPNITNTDESFDGFYIYTTAVCDIILNPSYPNLECAKKPLNRRFQRFKVFIVVK
jgi:hypothetical protein